MRQIRSTPWGATIAALALSIMLLAQSCGGADLEGDWFVCEDEACATLDDDGIRLTADGRWGALEAADGGTYEPGEAYGLDTVRGNYTFDGETLTLVPDVAAEPQSARVWFQGELLVLQARQVHRVCGNVTTPADQTPAEQPRCREEEHVETIRLKRIGPAAGGVPFTGEDPAARGGGNTVSPPPPPPAPAP